MYQRKDKRDPLTLVNNHTARFIRIRSVLELTGLSKSYVYDLSNRGLFPKNIQLIPGGTSVAWLESEIQEWIGSRVQERDEGGINHA